MRKWIGLVGRSGSGKDYTYTRLREIDSRAARIALADGLKLDIEAALGSHLQRINVLWERPYTADVRRLLQWWGTELRRDQDQDYWVTKGLERVSELRPRVYPVFTDIRFENEAEMIRSHGGLLVRVVCSNEIRRKRLGGELPPDHASETEQDAIQCDWQILSEEGNESYEGTLMAILIDSGFKGVRGPEITD